MVSLEGAILVSAPADSSWPLVSPNSVSGALRCLQHLPCFIPGRDDRSRGNGFKLKEGRFRLGIRKKFFTMRLTRSWHRLPREAVASPSLAVFRAGLDGALSNLGW